MIGRVICQCVSVFCKWQSVACSRRGLPSSLEKEFYHFPRSPRALSTYTKTLPLWLRYVDDTFTAVHKDEIDTFHEHLNRQNPHIQFTKEIEENGKIPFLDCLVSRDENKLLY